jgi:hypothetical protein
VSKSRMRIIEVMASVGIVLVLASARTQAAPTSAPDLSAATAASNAPSAAPSTKPIKKRFLLSRSSRVYQRPECWEHSGSPRQGQITCDCYRHHR